MPRPAADVSRSQQSELTVRLLSVFITPITNVLQIMWIFAEITRATVMEQYVQPLKSDRVKKAPFSEESESGVF